MSTLQDQAELKALRSFLRISAPQMIDDRFSSTAREGLAQMLHGSATDRMGALALISAVQGGMLSGIRDADGTEDASALASGGRNASLSAPIGSSPMLLLRSGGQRDGTTLSDAVALLNAELKAQAAPAATHGFGCLVHCSLCAAVIVDEGLTAFSCLVCLTCAGDA